MTSEDQKALQKEAYHEALRRYPEAHGALVFLWKALGLDVIGPTAEHVAWAKSIMGSKGRQS